MATWHSLTQQISRLYSKVFPIPCLLCGLPTEKEALCDGCINDLPTLQHACHLCSTPLSKGQICGRCLISPPIQQQSLSLFIYDSNVKRCISAFKYHQQIHLAKIFATLFIKQHKLDSTTLPDCIIPIPLHPKRLAERGYNQSALFCQQLSQQLHIATHSNYLTRIKNTSSQASLNAKQRRKNMRDAFEVSCEGLPEHVALVDDVMTSGATCSAAANELKKSGVKHIEVWTIARAISHY
ncbi:hypothetical protein LCGC14_1067080 [marine sediment metagenome]|uniref:Double zinc ribbon domain-containing protein n=1 Tax=marine sediment metagenome TaxID=412755 RepID=A0A0F9N6F2_9ZZZZ